MERPSRYKRPARINLTDKDARLTKTRQGIVPGYNVQAVVSPLATDDGMSGMLVTAVDVVDESYDSECLPPMVKKSEDATGVRVPLTLADAGYFAGKHVAEFHSKGQQVVMPDKARRTDHPYHKDQFAYDERQTATSALTDRAFHSWASSRPKRREHACIASLQEQSVEDVLLSESAPETEGRGALSR